jgi:hypothetical protein
MNFYSISFNPLVYHILFLSFLIGCYHPYCIERPETKTLTLKPGSEGKDAVYGLFANMKFGDSPFLTGYYFDKGRGLQVYIFNGYIDFDLSKLPPNVEIKEATLKLYIDTSAVNFNNIPLSERINPDKWALQPVIEKWDETVLNVNIEPLTAGQYSVNMPPNKPDYTCEIEVTNMLRKQYLNPDRFFGFLIFLKSDVMEREEIMKNLRYCSSDHINANWHPELIVRYETFPN